MASENKKMLERLIEMLFSRLRMWLSLVTISFLALLWVLIRFFFYEEPNRIEDSQRIYILEAQRNQPLIEALEPITISVDSFKGRSRDR